MWWDGMRGGGVWGVRSKIVEKHAEACGGMKSFHRVAAHLTLKTALNTK